MTVASLGGESKETRLIYHCAPHHQKLTKANESSRNRS